MEKTQVTKDNSFCCARYCTQVPSIPPHHPSAHVIHVQVTMFINSSNFTLKSSIHPCPSVPKCAKGQHVYKYIIHNSWGQVTIGHTHLECFPKASHLFLIKESWIVTTMYVRSWRHLKLFHISVEMLHTWFGRMSTTIYGGGLTSSPTKLISILTTSNEHVLCEVSSQNHRSCLHTTRMLMISPNCSLPWVYPYNGKSTWIFIFWRGRKIYAKVYLPLPTMFFPQSA